MASTGNKGEDIRKNIIYFANMFMTLPTHLLKSDKWTGLDIRGAFFSASVSFNETCKYKINTSFSKKVLLSHITLGGHLVI